MCGRAEPVDGRARPKVSGGCEAKGSRAKQGLYDVIIQCVRPGIGPEGMPVIVGIQSRCT